jgi:hypothetical protein
MPSQKNSEDRKDLLLAFGIALGLPLLSIVLLILTIIVSRYNILNWME